MNCTIVILGASGDLTKRKLIPAIYNLLLEKKLRTFAVVGVALDKVKCEKILANARPHIKRFDPKVWDALQQRFHYFASDFYDKDRFCKLGQVVRDVERQHKLSGNRLFYLATLPQHFKVIADNLRECGLAKQTKNWSRVVFEKPFGQDLKSAKKINKCIKEIFSEKQIYRIDHYLGKELVQNIAVARFTNTILEPVWNRRYVDHVQIILSENIGVEGRGKFYDNYGALKDVVQNHMLQLLSLTAMEFPKKLHGDYIRDEKIKILRKIKLTPEVVLGQYNGYRREKGVKKNSNTETFAALKVYVNNKRWKGVPFYLFAGKNMKDKINSIYVEFKKSPCILFDGTCNFSPNYFAVQIQPEEGFYTQLNAKVPGKSDITSVKMDFCHSCKFGPNTPQAYENLLLDVIKGDQSVFIRTDEIEHQWKIVDEIVRKKPHVQSYRRGDYPSDAKKMIRGTWHLRLDKTG